jgi:hypothetical protein
MKNIFIFLAALTTIAAISNAIASNNNNSFGPVDATQSSVIPHIPEPMLFDLVRPLGAAKGELEINTLVDHVLRGGYTEWAPEIEYAYADGYAIELELPFDDLSVAEYKLALQGTFGVLLGSRMIHGWQIIGRYDRHDKAYLTDTLYLNGMRFSGNWSKWSMFNMFGMRNNYSEKRERFGGLLNNSIFYSFSRQLTLGFEINNEMSRWERWRYRLVPQIHYDFTPHTALQVGGGPSKLHEDKKTEWTVTWRLIHAF